MRSITGPEEVVRSIWDPSSVAIVGASGREGSLVWWPQRLLQQFGFAGRIAPVNPNRNEIGGLPCYPSMREVGRPIDVAVITLDAPGTARAVVGCAEAGVGAVVLPGQGFGESGEEGRWVEDEMLAAARANGTRIYGPNSDGVANFASGAVISIQPVFGAGVELGRVAVITQSGGTAGSLVARLREAGIGVKYSRLGRQRDRPGPRRLPLRGPAGPRRRHGAVVH